MQEIHALAQSNLGPLLGVAFIFAGIMDIVLGELFLRKQVLRLKNDLTAGLRLEQKASNENRMKSLQMVKHTMFASGIGFIAIGAFMLYPHL